MEHREVRGKLVFQGECGKYIQVLKYCEGVNKIGSNPLITDITIKQKSISQIHAELLCQANTLRIIDLNSKTGVFVNSQSCRIGSEYYTYINPYNDTLYLGSVKCKFFPSLFSSQMEEQTVKGEVQCRKRKIKKKQKMDGLFDFREEKKGINLQRRNDSKGRSKRKSKGKASKNSNERPLENQNNCPQEEFSKKITHFILKTHQLDFIKDHMSQQTKANSNEKSLEAASMQMLNQESILKDNQKGKVLKQEDCKQVGSLDIEVDLQNMKEDTQRVRKRPKKKSCEKRGPGTLIQVNAKKEEKKSQSCETKLKIKKSRKTKTIDMAQQRSKSRSKQKNIKNRKKFPDYIQASDSNLQGKRSIVQKTALLSNFTLAFKPTTKITVTQNWRDTFDVLVMDKYSRTFKLLYSICLGIPVVNKNWIIQSQYRRGIAPIQRFLLQSPSNLVQTSVAKAKNKRVFDKLKFCLLGSDESFHLPVQQVQVLIGVGGGQLLKDISEVDENESILVVLPLKFEEDQVRKIQSKKHKEKCYTIQMILDSCLNQQIAWQKNKIQVQ